MNPHTISPISVIALLDRLDPRLDEPCRVPGCVHHAHATVAAPVDRATSERIAA